MAFSGGQDSTCLLHALATGRLGARARPDLVAVHVDHGLRASSADEAEAVRALAATFGVEVLVRRVDVRAYRARIGRSSLQQAARAARYHTLAQVAGETGAAAVVVGHTADDQAETVLLHLLRGAGLAGLAGMRLEDVLIPEELGPAPSDTEAGGTSVPKLRLVHPLLRVERQTTLAYCRAWDLAFVEDASNATRMYTRNRVRLDLLPALERFNPAIRGVLARTADLAAADLEALDLVAAALFATLVQADDAAGLRFDRPAFLRQPRALQRRLLRLGIQHLIGNLADVPAGPIEDALEVLAASIEPARHTRQPQYHLPRGVRLASGRDVFTLSH